MRLNPWHIRQPTFEEYRWFNNLILIHSLTHSWIEQVSRISKGPYLLPRAAVPALNDKLLVLDSMLEGASPADLDRLLLQSEPRQFLLELEASVWASHSYAIENIIDRSRQKELPAVQNLLSQAAWKEGRRVGAKSSANYFSDSGFKISNIASMVPCLDEIPFWRYPRRPTFLLERKTSDSIRFQILHCPHFDDETQTRKNADQLCAYHFQWVRGFFYSFSEEFWVEYDRRGDSVVVPGLTIPNRCGYLLSARRPKN